MSPEQQLKEFLLELAALRAEMKHLRALLKGDTLALETLLELARKNSEDVNARLN